MSRELTRQEKHRLYETIRVHLEKIESCFKPGLVEITIIVRNKELPTARVMVSSENNIEDAICAIRQLTTQPGASTFP